MGLPESLWIAWCVAVLGLGGLLAVALGLALHHTRRSRLPGYARSRRAAAAVTEGPALLGGVVEAGDDDAPVLSVDTFTSAEPGRRTRVRRLAQARPFSLRLPSGAAVRVEPAEGQWSLDTTFVPAARDGHMVYVALVEPGQVVYVSGAVRREVDPAVAGTGYRDVARTAVLRGELAFFSATVIAAHAARARFHARWAAGLAAGLTALNAASVRWAHAALTHPIVKRDADDGTMLMVALVAGVGLAYWLRSEATTPWVRRVVVAG
jgi:hypothetical protein